MKPGWIMRLPCRRLPSTSTRRVHRSPWGSYEEHASKLVYKRTFLVAGKDLLLSDFPGGVKQLQVVHYVKLTLNAVPPLRGTTFRITILYELNFNCFGLGQNQWLWGPTPQSTVTVTALALPTRSPYTAIV